MRNLILALALLLALAACGSSSTPTAVPGVTPLPAATPTSAPTEPGPAPATPTPVATATTGVVQPTTTATAAPLAGARLAVQLADNSIIFIDANGNKQPVTKVASPIDVASIDPFANAVGSTLVLPLSGATPSAVRVDSSGAKELPFLKGALSGLVAGADHLAWGTANLSAKPPTTELMISAVKRRLGGAITALDEAQRAVLTSIGGSAAS